VFITARKFNQNPKNWVRNRCRLVARDVPQGGSPLQEPRNHSIRMSRLVAMNSPPGDFWKFSRNPKFVKLIGYKQPIVHAFHTD